MKHTLIIFSLIILLISLLNACIIKRSQFSPFEIKQAQDVLLIESLPNEGENCEFFGSTLASDGSGQGDFGVKGTRKNALIQLKVQAANKQANRVLITKETIPHFNYGLNKHFDNLYSIEANMYFCRQ